MNAPMNVPESEDFWQWSLSHYARKDVEKLLLQLQDEFDFNVNIALWCCWCAEIYETAPDLALRHAIDQTGAWSAHVTGPLRAVRRFLKTHRETHSAASENLREKIKQGELDAEKEEQSRLQRLADSALTPLGAEIVDSAAERRQRARLNLAAYAALIGAGKRNRFMVSLLEELSERIYPTPDQNLANGE